MKKLYFIILVLCSTKILAQSDIFDITKRLDPIEPTAAGIGKYGEYQVNYSTGLPNIVIPIYTIKCGNLQLPIELRYHGGGIKVNEESSWVGLGWDLFYGGEITRQVNGYPDEHEDLKNVPIDDDITDYMDDNPYNFTSALLTNLSTNSNTSSFMQDIYFYNINGYSGKFILDNDEKPTEIPYSNNRIDFLGGTSVIHPNKIVTTDGTVYEFAIGDETQVLPMSSGYPSYISTWHLHRIVSSDANDIINFTYQNDGTITSGSCGYSEGIIETSTGCDGGININYSKIPMTSSANMQRVTSKKPSIIDFANGRIKFLLGSRDDIYCDISDLYNDRSLRRLNELIIEERLDNGSYIEKFRFVFEYSYFQACSIMDSRDNSKIFPSCLKLRLNRVFKYSNGLIGDPEIIADFGYFDSEEFPKKGSYSIDYWGYFNGENNLTPIPEHCMTYNSQIYMIGGANRNCVEDKMKASSLQSITFPTKGRTLFDWEINRYGNEDPVVNFKEDKTISLTMLNTSDLNHTDDDGLYPIDPDENEFQEESFYIGIPQYVTIKYKLNRTINTLDHEKYDRAEIILYNNTDDNEKFNCHNVYSDNTLYEKLIFLTKGFYNLRMWRNCGNVYSYVSIKHNSFNPDLNQYNHPIGGLRIKSITNLDLDGKQIDRKEFKYLEPGTEISSGVLSSSKTKTFVRSTTDIKSILTYSQLGDVSGCTLEHTKYYRAYSDEQTGVYSNNVTYKHVQVYDVSLGNIPNGYTDLEYDVVPDYFIGEEMPIISNDWQRGQLLRETIYSRSEDGVFKKVKETINEYSVDNRVNKEIMGFKMINYMNIIGYCSLCTSFTVDFVYGPTNYWYSVKWKHLDKSTTTDFYESGNIINSTYYNYDNVKYNFPNRSISINSQGQQIETITKYPLDFTINETIPETNDSDMSKAIYKMVDFNMISQPIEFYSIKNNMIIGARFNYYYDFGNFVNLKEIYELENNSIVGIGNTLDINQIDETNKFNPSNIWFNGSSFIGARDNLYSLLPSLSLKYTSEGRVEEFKKKNDVKTAIYWAYNSTYPIIKAENAEYDIAGSTADLLGAVAAAPKVVSGISYTTVDTFLAAITAGGGFINSNGTLNTANTSAWANFISYFKTKLPAAMVTFYTYDPLVGMTSETAPNGVTTYYEYDSFGRLYRVKDQDGKILKQYEYNYANQ